MNPLDRINQRQREARQAMPPPSFAKASTVKPSVAGAGRLAQYQAAMEAAISAMTNFPAMTPERLQYKRNIVPQLMPFVDLYVKSGEKYPNDVAVQCMIWLFDIGDIEQALKLGLYLVATRQQHMPRKFDRDLETFLLDSTYDWAAEKLKAKSPAAPYLGQCIDAMQTWENIHPIVRGKMYALQAKHFEMHKEYQAALTCCIAAQKINPEGHGTKGLRERLEAKLKESPALRRDSEESEKPSQTGLD